jgi:hypothetical protein
LTNAGAVSEQAAEVLTNALADPSFLFITSLRYRILAQKVSPSSGPGPGETASGKPPKREIADVGDLQ